VSPVTPCGLFWLFKLSVMESSFTGCDDWAPW
jgi:hypothetical protein